MPTDENFVYCPECGAEVPLDDDPSSMDTQDAAEGLLMHYQGGTRYAVRR